MKRVLVIQNGHLLTDGILSLLTGEIDLSIFDSIFSNETAVLEDIKKIKPEVLIMDESSPFIDHFSFLSCLNDCPELRVIIIDEHNNLMRIYDKQEIVVCRVADLMAAIRKEEQYYSE